MSGPDEVARWCDRLARTVRAGHALRLALLAVEGEPNTTLGRATERLEVLLERGADPARALRRVGEERSPGDPIASAFVVLAVAAELGGPLGDPLDRVASVLRVRAADEAERSAHSAQARLSAHVLTAVPVGFLALTAWLDADVRSVVAATPGAPIVGVGVVLNLLGGWWMRRIVGGSDR